MGSESPNINLINNFASLASNEGAPQIVMSSGRIVGSQLLSLPPSSNPFLSPDPPPRPSLKRSRSSPTLSPPLTSQLTPFHQFKTPSKTSQNPLFPFTNSPSLDVLNPDPSTRPFPLLFLLLSPLPLILLQLLLMFFQSLLFFRESKSTFLNECKTLFLECLGT